MAGYELVGVVLLALALLALVAVTGPASLGALAGAGLCLGLARAAGRKC